VTLTRVPWGGWDRLLHRDGYVSDYFCAIVVIVVGLHSLQCHDSVATLTVAVCF
jgi:hypothetical protein